MTSWSFGALGTLEVRRALGLWRGPVLADVPSEALHRDDVPALEEQRLAALELSWSA